MLRSFAAGLGAAALCALFLALLLSIYDEARWVELPLLRWTATLLFASVLCEIMAPRGLPLLLYAAVNAAVAAGGIYAVTDAALFVPASGGYAVFLGCMVGASVAFCALYAQKQPDSNLYLRITDMLLIGMVVLLACACLLKKPVNMPVLGFATAGLALSLATTAKLRAGGESENVVRGSGIGGFLVLGAVLAACLLICLALILLGGGQVEGIVAAASAVWRMLGWIAEKGISLFAAFLALDFGRYNVLKPEVGYYTVSVIPLDDEQAAGQAPMWIVYGFLLLLAVALLALIIGFLLDFKGKRVLRAERTRKRRVVTRKSHLLAALAALLGSARDAAAFEMTYRFGPRIPQTLFVFAVRRHRGRRKNESPGVYMRRLHATLCAQGEASSLDRLAELIDAAVYGGQRILLTRQEYAQYSAQICAVQVKKRNEIDKKGNG